MADTTPPEYRSSNSVTKRQTLFIDVNDPRAKKGKLGIVQGRSGVEIQLVNTAAGMSLSALQSNYGVTSGQINAIEDQYAPMTGDQIISQTSVSVGKPDAITGLTASWSGTTLQISWVFNAASSTNKYVSEFVVEFTQGSINTFAVNATINSSSSNQVYNFNQIANAALFGTPQTSFDSITVYAQDVYGNQGAPQTINPPTYSGNSAVNGSQYIRNIYVNPISVTPTGGSSGDIWISY